MLKCPACGAPFTRFQDRCTHCHLHLPLPPEESARRSSDSGAPVFVNVSVGTERGNPSPLLSLLSGFALVTALLLGSYAGYKQSRIEVSVRSPATFEAAPRERTVIHHHHHHPQPHWNAPIVRSGCSTCGSTLRASLPGSGGASAPRLTAPDAPSVLRFPGPASERKPASH